MNPKETKKSQHNFEVLKLTKTNRGFISELRHKEVNQLTPNAILDLYYEPGSKLKEIVDDLDSAEKVFVFDAFVVMQARYESILKEYEDDSSMASTIPIIRTVNIISACNRAMKKFVGQDLKKETIFNDDKKRNFFKAIIDYLESSSDESLEIKGIEMIRKIRSEFNISTPPLEGQTDLDQQIKKLVLSTINEADQVAEIPMESASDIKPIDYGLGSSANRINIVRGNIGLIDGDRHFMGTAISEGRWKLGLVRKYFVPSMDQDANKLINQESMFTRQFASKFLKWLRTLRYDMSIFSETDEKAYREKYYMNRFYDDFAKKYIQDSNLNEINLQRGWISYISSIYKFDSQYILQIINNLFPQDQKKYISFLSSKVNKEDVFRLVSDFLLTKDEINIIIDLLNEIRIKEQRELQYDDYHIVVNQVRKQKIEN